MKVAHVVRTLGWSGGVQEYVAGLARGLTELGHEVLIFAAGEPPPHGPEMHAFAAGLDVVHHPSALFASRYRYPRGLARALRDLKDDIDVIHVHQAFYPGTWIAASSRVPLVGNLYLHSDRVMGRGTLRRRLALRGLVQRLDAVAAISSAELDTISGVRSPKRSAVVWPGIEHDISTFSHTDRRPLVLWVGRLALDKGLGYLIDAFAELPPSVDVAIVGRGRDEDACMARCAAAGLDPQRVMVGDLGEDDVIGLMRQASVFVSASPQESFGIAALKAVAHGCRPVLSDIPSHREIVTTLGVDCADLVDLSTPPQGFAKAIERALAKPRLPVQVAERVPTWRESARRLVELYDNVRRTDPGDRYRNPDN